MIGQYIVVSPAFHAGEKILMTHHFDTEKRPAIISTSDLTKQAFAFYYNHESNIFLDFHVHATLHAKVEIYIRIFIDPLIGFENILHPDLNVNQTNPFSSILLRSSNNVTSPPTLKTGKSLTFYLKVLICKARQIYNESRSLGKIGCFWICFFQWQDFTLTTDLI